MSTLWGSRSISPSTTPISRTYNRNTKRNVNNKHYKEVHWRIFSQLQQWNKLANQKVATPSSRTKTHFLRSFPVFLSKNNSYFTSTNDSVIKMLFCLSCVFTISIFHKSKAPWFTATSIQSNINVSKTKCINLQVYWKIISISYSRKVKLKEKEWI